MAHIFMFMPLLALALFRFLPWQWALPLYLPLATGEEAMTGDQALVAHSGYRATRVHYQGETWRAVSSCSLCRGQRVCRTDGAGWTVGQLRERLNAVSRR